MRSRNVTRAVPTLSETFISENYVDMMKAMRACRDAGFDGSPSEGHWPSKAFALGYMKPAHAGGACEQSRL